MFFWLVLFPMALITYGLCLYALIKYKRMKKQEETP